MKKELSFWDKVKQIIGVSRYGFTPQQITYKLYLDTLKHKTIIKRIRDNWIKYTLIPNKYEIATEMKYRVSELLNTNERIQLLELLITLYSIEKHLTFHKTVARKQTFIMAKYTFGFTLFDLSNFYCSLRNLFRALYLVQYREGEYLVLRGHHDKTYLTIKDFYHLYEIVGGKYTYNRFVEELNYLPCFLIHRDRFAYINKKWIDYFVTTESIHKGYLYSTYVEKINDFRDSFLGVKESKALLVRELIPLVKEGHFETNEVKLNEGNWEIDFDTPNAFYLVKTHNGTKNMYKKIVIELDKYSIALNKFEF